MSLATDLRTFLLADTGISADVGTRFYPDQRAQDSDLPAIVYEQITAEHLHDLDGAAGYARPTFQITCWASARLAARALSDKVRKRIDGFRGSMGASQVDGVLLIRDTDIFEPSPDRYGVEMDFDIWGPEALT